MPEAINEIPMVRVTNPASEMRGVTLTYEIWGQVPRTVTLLPGDTLTIQVPRDAVNVDKMFTLN